MRTTVTQALQESATGGATNRLQLQTGVVGQQCSEARAGGRRLELQRRSASAGGHCSAVARMRAGTLAQGMRGVGTPGDGLVSESRACRRRQGSAGRRATAQCVGTERSVRARGSALPLTSTMLAWQHRDTGGDTMHGCKGSRVGRQRKRGAARSRQVGAGRCPRLSTSPVYTPPLPGACVRALPGSPHERQRGGRCESRLVRENTQVEENTTRLQRRPFESDNRRANY